MHTTPILQVPQFIMDNAFENHQRVNIVVTQPRRIGARSLAERVSRERKWELGTVVGYQVSRNSIHIRIEFYRLVRYSISFCYSNCRSHWTKLTHRMTPASCTAPPVSFWRSWSRPRLCRSTHTSYWTRCMNVTRRWIFCLSSYASYCRPSGSKRRLFWCRPPLRRKRLVNVFITIFVTLEIDLFSKLKHF